LRIALTASIVRAAIASPAQRLPDKVFATGPVFRYERPSRGRFRQFTQTGVEVLGADSALADAEIIALAATTLDSLGITGYVITIGNVGILSDVLGRLGLTGRRRAILLESLEETRRQGIDAVRRRFETLDPDAAAARADMRNMGLMYANSTIRMHVPSELRRIGLDLALQLFTQKRFEFKLNVTDFRAETVRLPVMVADQHHASIIEIEALPTFEGYYAALVPLGANKFSVGLMLGKHYALVQIDSARAMPASRQFTSAWREKEVDLLPRAVAEGCEMLMGNLLSLASADSFLYFTPPTQTASEDWTLRVVFRPLVARPLADTSAAPSNEFTSAQAT